MHTTNANIHSDRLVGPPRRLCPAEATLLSLPNEVLESILVACAEEGHPETIAAVAGVCNHLFNLVYRTSDQHLWRSLFLTTFDEPRVHRFPLFEGIDWQQAFEDRIWTRHFTSKRAQPLVLIEKRKLRSGPLAVSTSFLPSSSDDAVARAKALQTLCSVILSAAPRPPDRLATEPRVFSSNRRSSLDHLVELSPRVALFPPDSSSVPPSSNIAWLRETLANGLPPALTIKISPSSKTSTNPKWHESAEGLMMGKFICHIGFTPIPTQISTDAEAHALPRSNAPGASHDVSQAVNIDMSESAQRTRALWYARKRVFNMRYLSHRRHWGPYLPVHPNDSAASARRSTNDDDEDGGDDDSDDDDDPDWVPTGHRDASRTVYARSAEQLIPDWSWLAAARVVLECTLRKHQSVENVQRLEAWDNLREGTWLRPEKAVSSEDDAEGGGQFDDGKKYERDWAGVEGVWRRFVCWLGYDTLIFHNLHGGFNAPNLNEVWIIVPVTLRVTGYSPSPIPKYADRPTIHFEGEMGGADWQGDVELPENEDVRKAYGTVSMLADGNVRWCLTSMGDDNEDVEWASEAIQLGGIGSAMGHIGMWTGANHEEDDPVGVFWQWRVG
ncbi:hypothetical protein C8Q79DRAFT_988118 [Trametes meyenii]|nr:hypothetical protein C8Q79DRAFT_988118 [Trametes meyenii]